MFIPFNTYMNCYWLYIYRNKWTYLCKETLIGKNYDETFTYLFIYIRTYLLSYRLTYLLTPTSRVLLEKLTGSQLVKGFPAYYGTRRFIIAFTSILHFSIQSWLDPVHIPTSHIQKLYPNISHPSTPGFPKWNPSLGFPHQNPVYAYPLPHTRYVPPESHSSRFYH